MKDSELLDAIASLQLMVNCRPNGVTVIEPSGRTFIGTDLRDTLESVIEQNEIQPTKINT